MHSLPADTDTNGLPSPTLTNPDMILPHGDDSNIDFAWSPLKQHSFPALQQIGATTFSKGQFDGQTIPQGDNLPTERSTRTSPGHDQSYGLKSSNPVDTSISGAWRRGSPVTGDDMGIHQEQDLEPLEHRMKDRHGVATPDTAWENEDETDPTSHSALSKRAEEILANAKKRLTKMESNLHRARDSLSNTEPSSIYSVTSSSSLGHWHLKSTSTSPAKHRQLDLTPSGGTMGHSRVFSETSVPSSLQTLPSVLEKSKDLRRPSSAMGSAATNFRDHDIVPTADMSRNNTRSNLTRTGSFGSRHNTALEPLHEDGPAPAFFSPSTTRDAIPSIGERPWSIKAEQKSTSSESGLPVTRGLTRSRSSLQMRELRDQMQDLRGKITSLKERAREDSLRRRSLQSLRTPNPFTAAEQWYTGADVYRQTTPHNESGFVPGEKMHALQPRILPKQIPSDQGKLSDGPKPERAMDNPYAKVTGESQEGDWFHDHLHNSTSASTVGIDQADNNGSGEVLTDANSSSETDSLSEEQDYHESSLSSVGERHEDRADAFDYEHFFLHSGMGNFSRRDLGRRASLASSGSVETTKPATPVTQLVDDNENTPRSSVETSSGSPPPKQSGHTRQNSVDSISTVATFATANEVEGSEQELRDVNQKPSTGGSWKSDGPDGNGARQVRKDGPDSERGNEIDGSTDNDGFQIPIDHDRHSSPVPEARADADACTSSVLSLPDLVSALITTSRSREGHSDTPVQVSTTDQALVESVTTSLLRVCGQFSSGDQEQSSDEDGVWRRRLDMARRVLDGEIGDDGF